MFFQTIYPMLSAGTDLSINIRRVNNTLCVAVMPRHMGVKDESGKNLVPLILNGTPEELDAEFLKTITAPVSRALGMLTNLETFEKQTEKVSSKGKTEKTAVEKETKEAREKREKMEKLLKKADEAHTAHRHSEALTWLKQARVLAPTDKQNEIDIRMQEIQKQADAGSLFAALPEPQPQPQPAAQPQPAHPAAPTGNGMGTASMTQDGQMQMFHQHPAAVPQYTDTEPVPVPQPVIQETGSVPGGYPPMQPGYVQPAQYTGQPAARTEAPASQPVPPETTGSFPGGYPPMQSGYVQPAQYPGQHPVYPPQMQPVNGQPYHYQQPVQQPLPVQNASTGNREYRTPAQEIPETYSFDKDDETDRELLKENPYAEYIDFPEECRVKDEAQQEVVCC